LTNAVISYYTATPFVPTCNYTDLVQVANGVLQVRLLASVQDTIER
jgi:hypothetical protein